MKAGFGTGAGPAPAQPGNAPAFVPPPVAELAKLFPQLEILELLGQGGMGAVYKARQPSLDRLVALKILPPQAGGDSGFADRFTREARALAKLSHPNIVAVHEFGQAGGLHYFVMEYVEGLNLRQLEQAGKLSPREALQIIPQICDALQFAHDEGIVHRDIKPENVMLDKKGRVKVADFGLARILGREPEGLRLTGAQDVMGTPHYMAPEQLEHPQEVDHRADIYSLGVVFYEMLTGELPLGKFQPPSQKVQVDVRLDEVVLRALEKEPARRYQQASDVKTRVETIAATAAPPGAALSPDAAASDKIILPAFLLAFFFGVFGVHRLYVGRIRSGLVQLGALVSWIPLIVAIVLMGVNEFPPAGIVFVSLSLGFVVIGCGIWATVDWILLLCKAFTDGQGRRITNWVHPGRREEMVPRAPEPAPERCSPQASQVKTGVETFAVTPSGVPPAPALRPASDPAGKARNVIKVLAVLSMVVGALTLVCCCPLNVFAAMPHNLKVYADQPAMVAWLYLTAILSLPIGFASLVGGIGLWKFKSWGRKVVVYKAVFYWLLQVIGIPIVTRAILGNAVLDGTQRVVALAAYCFIVLLLLIYETVLLVLLTRKSVKQALGEISPDVHEALPPPPPQLPCSGASRKPRAPA
jgi:hypothetical protein